MKKYFLTGLAIFLPLALTLFIVGFLIDFFTQPFMGLVADFLCRLEIAQEGFLFLTQEQVVRLISQLLILVLLFCFTLCIGVVGRFFFVNAFLKLSDKILSKIPLISTVYKTTQDIINTLFVSDKEMFKQVVMVPFPRQDIYVLGLISREAPPTCSKQAKEDLITVLIPTTPNPTTGFLLMYKKSDLIYIDMKVEDALKYIISCGMIS